MECKWINVVGFQLYQIIYLTFLLHLTVQKCWSLNYEGLTLLSLRGRVSLDPYGALSNWNPYDEDPCNWYGVHCEGGKVVSLDLAELSLHGMLAPELGQLIHLQKLILCHNNFYGTIPKELGELENLELLNLGHNYLFGQIPSDIGNISTLKSLLLSNNLLEGSIPSELCNLISLSELQLDRNQLSGFIPGLDHSNRKLGKSVSLCDLKHLMKADFSFNYIEGGIPACLNHITWSSFKWNCFHYQTSEQRFQQECGSRRPHSYQGEHITATERARLLADSFQLLRHSSSKGGTGGSQQPLQPSPSPSSLSPNALLSPSFGPSLTPTASPSPSPQDSSRSSSRSLPSTKPVSSPPEPIPTLDPPSTVSSKKSSTWMYRIGIPVLASFVVTSVLIICICNNRNVATIRPWRTGISGQLQKAFVTGVPKLKRVELEAACEEFSNIIGSSSDSMIFKGTLSSGVEIAVTSSTISSAKDWSARSEFYFRQKIEILSKINHKNFANLLGYCEEEDPFIRMMVFEYSPNGTLFEHLHNKESEHLDWATRMRIIMGIAYCLQYMHDLDPPVTHPSLNSNAVYLTDDYAAKMSDLDLWKEVAIKGDKMRSTSESGEFISFDDMELSERHSLDVEGNVFGFGVLLLEIISGKLPYTQDQGLLVNWAMEYLQNKEMINCMVDPSLKSFKNNELELVCEVAQSCVHPDPQQRPIMKEITAKLRGVISISPDAACPKLSPLWWAELEILSQDGS